MSESQLETILAYLRKHSEQYSTGALRKQLLATGHKREDVDLAIQIFEHENPETPRPRVWPWLVLIVILDTALTIGLSGPRSQQYWIVGVTVLAFLICGGEVVLALLLKIPRETRYGAGVLLQGAGLFGGLALLVLGGLCSAGRF